MEKILYPEHPVRCIDTGPSESGKSYFLKNLFSKIVHEIEKFYIYSPSLHQQTYQKLLKCFNNYILINLILNILSEEDIDLVNNEILKDEEFNDSDTEIESYKSIDELKHPQQCDCDQPIVIILDDLNEKEMKDTRVQAKFERFRHINKSIFIIFQVYYELQKRTSKVNGNLYHIFKPNISRDVQKFCQNKASKYVTLNEFKVKTSKYLNAKHQRLAIDVTKDI